MDPFQVSSIITAFLSIVLSVVVFTSNRKEKTNQSWAATTFLLGLWSLGLFGVVRAQSEATALYWQYLLDASASLIPVGFLFFVVHVLALEERYRTKLTLSAILGFLVTCLTFTPYFKTEMGPVFNFKYWISPGPLYPVLPAVFGLLTAYAFILLIKSWFQTTDRSARTRIVFILGAQLIGFGGGVTNFFPQLMNIYPFGNYFIALYVFFISYLIFRTGLFRPKVVATEFFIFVMSVFMLARTLLAQTASERIMDSGLLLGLIIFGLLLIKSVRNEINQRDELQKLAAKLRSANLSLEELNHFKSQLLSLASHQIKSPLAVIKGYAELLHDGSYGALTPAQLEVLDKTKHSADGLIGLIDDLLDLRKVDEGRMEYKFQPIDLIPLTKDVVDNIRPLADEKKIELKLVAPTLPILVAADAKLTQVVRNLIDNAIKYTPSGFVRVVLEDEGPNARISVTDSGYGIGEELLPHLFEEYMRDSRIKSQIRGTGLGLYIAKKIIEAHRGHIWAISPGNGLGSTFSIRLPKLISAPVPSASHKAPVDNSAEVLQDALPDTANEAQNPATPAPAENSATLA